MISLTIIELNKLKKVEQHLLRSFRKAKNKAVAKKPRKSLPRIKFWAEMMTRKKNLIKMKNLRNKWTCFE